MSEVVTVVLAAHRQPEHLLASVESIEKQTHPEVETVVVSPPAMPLAELPEGVIHHRSGRTDYAGLMSETLAISRGGYIAYLESGDLFSPRKVQMQVQALDGDPGLTAVFSAYQRLDDAGKVVDTVYMPGFPEQDLLYVLLHAPLLDRSTVMFRRSLYQQAGLADETPRAEIAIWSRLASQHRVGVLNRPLVRRRKPAGEGAGAEFPGIIPVLSSFRPHELVPAADPGGDLPDAALAAIQGAVWLKHRLFQRAADSFAEIPAALSSESFVQMWHGLLAHRQGDHERALTCFRAVPASDPLYLDAQMGAMLTRQTQRADPRLLERLQGELDEEFDSLLQHTLAIAQGADSSESREDLGVVGELQRYLGWSLPQVLDALFQGTMVTADEWQTQNPQTPQEVIQFYQEAGGYLFDLAWWHRTRDRKVLTQMAAGICRQNDVRRVLDFGCGIGQDGIILAQQGLQVTLADLPSRTFDFAKWRVQQRDLGIGIMNSDALSGQYDAILCFDVLEHVWNPEEIIRYLHRHLSDAGVLLITAQFEPDDAHPMHLERNRRYAGAPFIERMERVGFERVGSSQKPFVFRKNSDQNLSSG